MSHGNLSNHHINKHVASSRLKVFYWRHIHSRRPLLLFKLSPASPCTSQTFNYIWWAAVKIQFPPVSVSPLYFIALCRETTGCMQTRVPLGLQARVISGRARPVRDGHSVLRVRTWTESRTICVFCRSYRCSVQALSRELETPNNEQQRELLHHMFNNCVYTDFLVGILVLIGFFDWF